MSEWPPSEQKAIQAKIREWSAWYSGERQALERAGSSYGMTETNPDPAGVVRAVARVWRRFWHTGPAEQTTSVKIRVHDPLAADIARASADLLFSEPPQIQALQLDDTPHPWLEAALDEAFWGVLAGAAETCAALGGVYLRLVWVVGLRPEENRLFVTRVDVDGAVPSFRWGKLNRVKFWRRLPALLGAGAAVFRHVEVHELDAKGVGVVFHELYRGGENDLGVNLPLDNHPDTAGLIALLDTEDGAVSTRTPGLDVVYIPNVTPNPLWRDDPVGCHLGAPDIAGAEDILDRRDHVLSALMREVDLAKARLTVPNYMLDVGKPGQGVAFDTDREIWSPLNIPAAGAGGVQPKPEMFQPEIRVEQHLAVFDKLTDAAVRSAGYSAVTFGEDGEGAAITATEVNSKTARSRLTRAKKIRHWSTGLQELVEKMVGVALAFGWVQDDPAGLAGSTVVVQFPQPQQTPKELAEVTQLLFNSQSASTEVRVRLFHPDWEDQDILDEVDKILEEVKSAAPPAPDLSSLGQSDPFAVPDVPAVTPEAPGAGVDNQAPVAPVGG